MLLPKPGQVVEAATKYASTILLYGKPKVGKSSILSELSKRAKCLIIDTEKSHKMLDSVKVEVDPALSEMQKWHELVNIQREIYNAGLSNGVYTPVYDILVVDTLTRVDEWSEYAGTEAYMQKPQGKAFNRKVDARNQPTKDVFSIDDPEWTSVHEIAQGFGYRYSRDEMIKIINRFGMLAPVVIFTCHVKDKLVGAALGEEVSTKTVNLTGKVGTKLASEVDTIMYVFRDEDKLMASFSNEDGSRVSSLSGKTITFSEKNKDGSLKVNWEQVIDPKYLN